MATVSNHRGHEALSAPVAARISSWETGTGLKAGLVSTDGTFERMSARPLIQRRYSQANPESISPGVDRRVSLHGLAQVCADPRSNLPARAVPIPSANPLTNGRRRCILQVRRSDPEWRQWGLPGAAGKAGQASDLRGRKPVRAASSRSIPTGTGAAGQRS